MSYRNPFSSLIESLFRSYPFMELSQRLMIIGSMARAIDPKIESKMGFSIADVVSKARELELLLEINVRFYREGELEELKLPEDLKQLYDIESKLLSIVFSYYVKPSKGGVEKYV